MHKTPIHMFAANTGAVFHHALLSVSFTLVDFAYKFEFNDKTPDMPMAPTA